MTERAESERAELVTLADELEAISDNSYDRGQNATGEIITDAVTALRRLAAQDQKPVAWRYRYEMKEGAWGEVDGTEE